MKQKKSKQDLSLIPSSDPMREHIWFMQLALEEASNAWKIQEVPIGAVLVGPTGEILAKSHNIKEATNNPCGHAEVLAIQEACKKISDWRLNQCRLYVTLEPCPMCLAAIGQARLQQVVFGAYDPKGGALSLGYPIHKDKRLNHRFSVLGGVMHFECSKLLSQFFKERRPAHNT